MKRSLTLGVLLLGVSALALGGSGEHSVDSIGLVALSEAVASEADRSRIHLGTARIIQAEFAGPERAIEALRARRAQPLSLASADFDEDGVPDIVGGFRLDRGGILTLHRGNVDAIYPNTPEAQVRRRKGTSTSASFLPDAQAFETPDRPDFLGAGDFDADGHWDVVAASRGKARLVWHRGDGSGGFGPAQAIELTGRPTACVIGEINRRDGLTDVVVAVDGPAGPEALVFEAPEGAFARMPERLSLPAPATSLVLGRMDRDSNDDLMAAAGRHLVFVRGRDRRLSVTAPGGMEGQPAEIARMHLPFTATGMTMGHFRAKRDPDVALLAESGSVYAAPIAALLAAARGGANPAGILGDPLEQPGGAAGLATVKVSMLSGDDLLLVNRLDRRIEVVLPERKSASSPTGAAAGEPVAFSDRRTVALSLDGEPVLVLPMRLNSDTLNDLVVLADGPSALSVVPTGPLSPLMVVNTSDSGPGSLRAAMLAANASPEADEIHFAIAGAGPHAIVPATELPEITAPLTIDGTTQPGFSGTPIVVIDGSLLTSPAATGIRAPAGATTLRGLSVIHCADAGIYVADFSTGLGDWRVEGNFIGLDPGGVAAPNGTGVQYDRDGTGFIGEDVIIGGTAVAARNIISGNTRAGIDRNHCEACDRDLVIQGNYIGTNPAGTALVGVTEWGIEARTQQPLIGGTVAGARNVISGMSFFGVGVGYYDPFDPTATSSALVQGNYVGTNAAGLAALASGIGIYVGGDSDTIGGTTPAARNVVASGVSHRGVYAPAATLSLIQGNLIGLAVDGSTILGGGFGVDVSGDSNMIGGTTSGARNVISGNQEAGVVMGTGAELNTVAGNYIGTDASGNFARPNGRGIDLVGGATSNVIGLPSGRNVISGNTGFGVNLRDIGGNVVANNDIGLRADGTDFLGNGFAGIHIEDSDGNLIGGTSVEFQNVISHNLGRGILASSSGTGNAFLINAIYENGGMGIDLAPDGPNPNDPDPGDGPNHLQNYPVLTLAQWNGETVRVDGTLNSVPSSDFTLRVYTSESCDPSGHGEGKFYLGSFIVSSDASGLATFSQTLTGASAVGEAVTMTASHLGDTSEFSACKSVVGVAPDAVTRLTFAMVPIEAFSWDAVSGASQYNVYVGTRTTVSALATQAFDSCSAGSLPDTQVDVPPDADPPPGEMLWILVSASNQFGEGPMQPRSNGPRLLTSTGQCQASCVHDPCSVGAALVPACSLVGGFVCGKDPSCCDPVNGTWDFQCVQQVRTVGRSLTCPESQGQCAHTLCENGTPLQAGCDKPPLETSCTALVCAADPHCCQQAWDDACRVRMTSLCGYNCL